MIFSVYDPLAPQANITTNNHPHLELMCAQRPACRQHRVEHRGDLRHHHAVAPHLRAALALYGQVRKGLFRKDVGTEVHCGKKEILLGKWKTAIRPTWLEWGGEG